MTKKLSKDHEFNSKHCFISTSIFLIFIVVLKQFLLSKPLVLRVLLMLMNVVVSMT